MTSCVLFLREIVVFCFLFLSFVLIFCLRFIGCVLCCDLCRVFLCRVVGGLRWHGHTAPSRAFPLLFWWHLVTAPSCRHPRWPPFLATADCAFISPLCSTARPPSCLTTHTHSCARALSPHPPPSPDAGLAYRVVCCVKHQHTFPNNRICDCRWLVYQRYYGASTSAKAP